MKRYIGSQTVNPGLYFDARHVSFRSMEREGRLPGTTDDVYRRVPALALLVAGPLLGLAYVVFLPFIGVALVFWLLVKKAAVVAVESRDAVARVLAPAWRPGMAYLSRARRSGRKPRNRDRWAEKTKKRLEDKRADD